MNYLFDLDDTLYDHSQPFVHAYRAVFADRYDLDVHQLYLRHRIYSQEAFVRNEKKTDISIVTSVRIIHVRMLWRKKPVIRHSIRTGNHQ